MRDILSQIWEIFDYPSGQRLRPILKVEVQRLKKMGALKVSDAVAEKLNSISSATIDMLFCPIKERGMSVEVVIVVVGIYFI